MLDSAQKKALRSRGQRMDASVMVGKHGLTDNVLQSLEDHFKHHDLIKIRLPASSPAERKVLAQEIAEKVSAEVAGQTGRTWLLYRELPADRDS